MHAASAVVFITLVVTFVSGYPNVWHSNQLTPVHGLYVKPSTDGTTGDLFVAATEDSGVRSQWAVDQPINFLPVAATTQQHATAVPIAYPGYPTPHEESATHKRAVMPSPIPSAPVQYAYAMPVPSSTPTENIPVASYPYAYTIPSNPTEGSVPKCEHPASVPQCPYQFPFQLFYPQMMSAYTNAMSILKDAGLNEDSAKSVMSQASPTSMWPPSSYAYPMYVMVDPNAWNQNQATTTSSTPAASSSNIQSEENTQA